MKDRELFELVQRLNEIMVLRNQLDIEYNQIVERLWEKVPSLKEDVNVQKLVLERNKRWKIDNE